MSLFFLSLLLLPMLYSLPLPLTPSALPQRWPTSSLPLYPPPRPVSPHAVRCGTLECFQPNRLGTWANWTSDSPIMDTPETWKQVLCSTNKESWCTAANAEFPTLKGMETWILVPLQAKREIIKPKLVSRVRCFYIQVEGLACGNGVCLGFW